ncbi:hypothetical protein J6S46_02605, partial [Candidatus Saccharibacteria bacterium]|nr:hypothetical protein [Candidatus Saccharibacteria bacterium]
IEWIKAVTVRALKTFAQTALSLLTVVHAEYEKDYAKNTLKAHGQFWDKYPDMLTVYTIGDENAPVSREVCGGPHVEHTGVLNSFKIVKEESSAAGIRRIKAILE